MHKLTEKQLEEIVLITIAKTKKFTMAYLFDKHSTLLLRDTKLEINKQFEIPLFNIKNV